MDDNDDDDKQRRPRRTKQKAGRPSLGRFYRRRNGVLGARHPTKRARARDGEQTTTPALLAGDRSAPRIDGDYVAAARAIPVKTRSGGGGGGVGRAGRSGPVRAGPHRSARSGTSRGG